MIHGVWRIQGSLAVSRSIGDGHLKQWVIAEPETKIIKIKHEHEFLILASDGLWDKVYSLKPCSCALFFFFFFAYGVISFDGEFNWNMCLNEFVFIWIRLVIRKQ